MSKHILAATAAFTLCAAPVFADEARTPPPSQPYYAPQTASCDLAELKVYFEPGNAELTSFARDAIREAGDSLSGCSIVELDAMAMSSNASDTSLADARRAAVMRELQAHGIQSARTRLIGEVADNQTEAVMTRNVDIRMQAVPATIG